MKKLPYMVQLYSRASLENIPFEIRSIIDFSVHFINKCGSPTFCLLLAYLLSCPDFFRSHCVRMRSHWLSTMHCTVSTIRQTVMIGTGNQLWSMAWSGILIPMSKVATHRYQSLARSTGKAWAVILLSTHQTRVMWRAWHWLIITWQAVCLVLSMGSQNLPVWASLSITCHPLFLANCGTSAICKISR